MTMVAMLKKFVVWVPVIIQYTYMYVYMDTVLVCIFDFTWP